MVCSHLSCSFIGMPRAIARGFQKIPLEELEIHINRYKDRRPALQPYELLTPSGEPNERGIYLRPRKGHLCRFLKRGNRTAASASLMSSSDVLFSLVLCEEGLHICKRKPPYGKVFRDCKKYTRKEKHKGRCQDTAVPLVLLFQL